MSHIPHRIYFKWKNALSPHYLTVMECKGAVRRLQKGKKAAMTGGFWAAKRLPIDGSATTGKAAQIQLLQRLFGETVHRVKTKINILIPEDKAFLVL